MTGFAVWLVLMASGNQTTPSFPGGIIAWIICYNRRKRAIGGWLLFYYWQLYSSVVITAIFFGINFQSYIPENFEDQTRYLLFLTAALPNVLMLVVQAVVATFAIGIQTRDMANLLRFVLGAQVAATIVTVAIDSKYFPDNLVFSTWGLIQFSLWFAYFLFSRRVKHVFYKNDWDTAVGTFYPEKLQPAT